MVAIIMPDETHYIISCNMHYNESTELHELWISRPNKKNLKIRENTAKDEILLIKNAIDYVIENGDNALRLQEEV